MFLPKILKAFHLVEVGLSKSASSIEDRNIAVLSAIDKYCSEFDSDSNAKAIQQRAHKVKAIAGGTVKFLDDIKQEVVKVPMEEKKTRTGMGKQMMKRWCRQII